MTTTRPSPTGSGFYVTSPYATGGSATTSAAPPGYVVVDVSTLYPPASTINKAAVSIELTQQMIAGTNNVIPVLYGYNVRTGLLIVGMVTWNGNLYIIGLIGHGEIGAINGVFNNDTLLSDGSLNYPTHLFPYLGTQTQGVESALVLAYSSHGVTFADAMKGYAYVVVSLPPTLPLTSFPNLTAQVQGKKVLDMRDGITKLSANPVLCLADFITSPLYGMGKQINNSYFAEAANYCDELVGGEVRSSLTLALRERQRVEDVFASLVNYTGCICFERSGRYYIRPNKQRQATRNFTKDNIISGSLRMSYVAMRDLPTVVTVRYTNTSVGTAPYQTLPATASLPQVLAGTLPSRESIVEMPGVIRYSQAYREAWLRLKQLQYARLEIDFDTFDEALADEPYDVVGFEMPEIGVTLREFRLIGLKDKGFGRWGITLSSYDPEMFNYAPGPGPSPIDTTIMVEGLQFVFNGPITVEPEELYQDQTGKWNSRIRFNWPAPEGVSYYSYHLHEVTPEEKTFASGITALNEFVSYTMQEGKTYQLGVTAVSVLGVTSPHIHSQPIEVKGKQLLPGDVPRFAVAEAGGSVYMNWDPAIDIDIEAYEIRRGAVGAAWDDMVMVTVVHSLSYTDVFVAPGEYDYAIKAVDSVGGKSEHETRQTVTVTVDQNGAQVLQHTFNSYGLTNFMYFVDPVKGDWVLVNYDPDGTWDDGASPEP